MPQSTSHSQPRFLLDENVTKKLQRFLASKGFDVRYAPKGISNGKLAALSQSEKRVLITNDSDFAEPMPSHKDKAFSVVWLKVPQDKPAALLKSFSLLLKERNKLEDFKGQLIELNE